MQRVVRVQPLLLLQRQALQLGRLRVHGLQLVSCGHRGGQGGRQVPVRSGCGQAGRGARDYRGTEYLLRAGTQPATLQTEETEAKTGKSQSCKLPVVEKIQTSAWHQNPCTTTPPWAGPPSPISSASAYLLTPPQAQRGQTYPPECLRSFCPSLI